MLISVSELFLQENSEKKFSTDVDLSNASFSPQLVRFEKPVQVSGSIKNAGGVLILFADVAGAYRSVCDRCGTEISKRITFSFEEHFVKTQNAVLDGEALLLEEQEIDLVPILADQVFSHLPMKHLCTPDCKGLCPSCGKNLNDGPCDCKADDFNPQFEALKHLFDIDEEV